MTADRKLDTINSVEVNTLIAGKKMRAEDSKQPLNWKTASAFAAIIFGLGTIGFPFSAYWSYQTEAWGHVCFSVLMTIASAYVCYLSVQRFRQEVRR